MRNVASIRGEFRRLLANDRVLATGDLTNDSGDTVEIVGAQFVADEPSIFGKVSVDYVARELEWYLTKSRTIFDIRAPIPEIWRKIAGEGGAINSNYGIWSIGWRHFLSSIL